MIKLRAIGDVLLSTPVVQNLHDQFPKARIDFLTEKFAADVLIGNPWISEIVTFDRRKDSGLSIIRRVRRNGYDLVIDLFSNPRSALITGLSGARFRVGFPFHWRRFAYSVRVPPRGGEVHNVEFNLDALRQLSIPVLHTTPLFPVGREATAFAKEWIGSQDLNGKIVVGLNPSGGWYTKRWGLEHYAALGDLITEKHTASVVLLWGPGEEEDARRIQRLMKAPSFIPPPMTLPQLGALIQHCAYVVSNDSGPMHIAASLNVPTLGVFGPTNPHLQGPYGKTHRWIRNEDLDCLGCNLTKCPIGNVCMTNLGVERVMGAFDELYAHSKN